MAGVAPIPLSLARGSSPSTREKACIEILYSQALTTPWVASMVSALNTVETGSADLKATMVLCEGGIRWTRGLLIQAAVVDLLIAGDFPPDIDDRGVAEYIRRAFSNFVSGQTLNQLDTTAPKHEAEFYLRIWWALDSNRAGSLGHLLQTDMEQLLKPAREPPAIDPTSKDGGSGAADMSGLEMLSRAALDCTRHPDVSTGAISQQEIQSASKGIKDLRRSTSSVGKGSRSTTCGTQSTQLNILCRSRSSSDNSGQDHPSTVQKNVQQHTATRAAGGSTQSSERTTEISDDEEEQAHKLDTFPRIINGVAVELQETDAEHGKGARVRTKGKSSRARSCRPRRTCDNIHDDEEELDETEFRKKVQSVFHLPISEAAHALGVGVTVLKKQCRRINIPRWPYRKLASVEKLIESVEKVMNEENNNVGQAAVAELQELRKKIFEDPSLELDQQTKRLRQANFKQQYKLRQERSCKELTDVEQEALMACGAVGVLNDADIENGLDFRNTVAQDCDLPRAQSQVILPGVRTLSTYNMGDSVDGLFVAEQHAQQRKHISHAADQSPGRKMDAQNEEQKQAHSDLPLAARRARRATKQRRYHLSDSDNEEDEHAQATARRQTQSMPQGLPLHTDPVCSHGVLPQVGLLQNMAPHLYLQGSCFPAACQQLPDYYSLAHDPFTSGLKGSCRPLPLLRDHFTLQGTAQGMPAWHGQVPMDLGHRHRNQGNGASTSMHATSYTGGTGKTTVHARGTASKFENSLDSILRIAPLGALPQHTVPTQTHE